MATARDGPYYHMGFQFVGLKGFEYCFAKAGFHAYRLGQTSMSPVRIALTKSDAVEWTFIFLKRPVR